MREDRFGNPVSTTSDHTVAVINRFMDSFIGFGTDFFPIFAASDEDPDCALAAAYACLLGVFFENAEGRRIAAGYYARMRTGAAEATERERQFIAIIRDLHDGKLDRLLATLRRHVKEFPRDLFAAKLAQNAFFNIGDDAALLWVADTVIGHHKSCAYAYGMRAFGREQSSLLALAEEDGRRATDMQRKEPWAHHAVAHVMLTQGRHEEGMQWMHELSGEWDDRNSFMLTHNWWHQALFHLEMEDFKTPLALYDNRVWGVDKSYSLDQVNAISLLWRLEQLGVDVGDRWQDIGTHVAGRELYNDQPFYDMHYGYALARAGQEEAIRRLLDGMEKLSREAPLTTRKAWAEVALPATKGFIAIARGDHREALHHLTPARPRYQEIGGSHAQRDLFELAWITSLLAAGEYETAQPVLEARVNFRQNVPMDARLLARAQDRH
ncbi:MAG: tetratricopeptide repeat protein 38 family protein [Sneathiella sp.]|jgi:tetratricopeptide (TPR) repeat protein|uniref:tetratricopeptide repeat protein n=1 Tax=Sneathiella sp. TaxID=1964365 RepID=UPI000C3DAA86|nr:tetratricopeptide repeat protein [Sneathiella sp.]MAL78521.1 tetratricopeptide repeat protein 38 family protein [Sneathiella sp.]